MLILVADVLGGEDGVEDEGFAAEVLVMHIYGRNLVVFISSVVVDSLCGVAAGGVKGNLIFSFGYFAASSLLVYTAEDMEELADAFGFGFTGSGVHFCKCYLSFMRSSCFTF